MWAASAFRRRMWWLQYSGGHTAGAWGSEVYHGRAPGSLDRQRRIGGENSRE